MLDSRGGGDSTGAESGGFASSDDRGPEPLDDDIPF